MIRIPIPPDLPLREYQRLRSHADWYLRPGIRTQQIHVAERPVVSNSSRRLKSFTIIAATQVT